MAYSDYGGYAYRNGQRIIDRSDATITKEGDVFGTPGMWPGLVTIGMNEDDANEFRSWPSGHAVLGDGPIYVTLYKQSGLDIYRVNERLSLIDLVGEKYPKAVKEYEWEGKTKQYFDTEDFNESIPLIVEFDGYKIEALFMYQDNYYMYVKLQQPDGNYWHGWSGYGVGAGLENCGYGYSTSEREETMISLWPESIVMR